MVFQRYVASRNWWGRAGATEKDGSLTFWEKRVNHLVIQVAKEIEITLNHITNVRGCVEHIEVDNYIGSRK